MKKQKVNLMSLGATIAIMLLLVECSTKKQEEKREEGKKVEMTDTKPEPTATEIKVFEKVDASVKTQINGFLRDYFAVNKFDMSKLAGDQMDFYHAQRATLNQGLQGIRESADIQETRMELSTISESMYALVKAYHPNESELYYQFCPMAKNGDGANWLSSTKEIVNPYMGQRMPHCGRTKETIN